MFIIFILICFVCWVRECVCVCASVYLCNWTSQVYEHMICATIRNYIEKFEKPYINMTFFLHYTTQNSQRHALRRLIFRRSLCFCICFHLLLTHSKSVCFYLVFLPLIVALSLVLWATTFKLQQDAKALSL